MRRIRTFGFVVAMACALGGCSFEDAAAVDYDDMLSEGTSASGRPYQIQGFVHAETWTPAFLYVFPLLPSQSAERAKDLAISKAKSMGADAVTDVRVHVEVHMLFFWIAGWRECHVSATAVTNR
ncbi:MAG: hypothetical protein V2A76_03660 [Planctomycetota bacterium]